MITAYLTRYDALLCQDCALDTSDLANEGRNHLLGLIALPIAEALAIWPDACCEECKQPFAVTV